MGISAIRPLFHRSLHSLPSGFALGASPLQVGRSVGMTSPVSPALAQRDEPGTDQGFSQYFVGSLETETAGCTSYQGFRAPAF